jgi:hypothetical protein
VMEIRRETQALLDRLGVPDGKNPSPAPAAFDPADPPEEPR